MADTNKNEFELGLEINNGEKENLDESEKSISEKDNIEEKSSRVDTESDPLPPEETADIEEEEDDSEGFIPPEPLVIEDKDSESEYGEEDYEMDDSVPYAGVNEESAEALDNVLGKSDEVLEKLDQINEQIFELKQDFTTKLKYDGHKEKIIDRLHDELQVYKEDLQKKHLKSIVMDIIKMIDDIRKLFNHFYGREESERDSDKLIQQMARIPSDLEDLVFWHGVKAYRCDGDGFDPRRQRLMKKVKTHKESKDKTVAKSIRPGYEWDGKVIRPEIVSVYVYQPPVESEMRDVDER